MITVYEIINSINNICHTIIFYLFYLFIVLRFYSPPKSIKYAKYNDNEGLSKMIFFNNYISIKQYILNNNTFNVPSIIYN